MYSSVEFHVYFDFFLAIRRTSFGPGGQYSLRCQQSHSQDVFRARRPVQWHLRSWAFRAGCLTGLGRQVHEQIPKGRHHQEERPIAEGRNKSTSLYIIKYYFLVNFNFILICVIFLVFNLLFSVSVYSQVFLILFSFNLQSSFLIFLVSVFNDHFKLECLPKSCIFTRLSKHQLGFPATRIALSFLRGWAPFL